MFTSPLSASPYEVLGVAASASDDEIRRAHRRRLRETHPDAGGDAAAFIQVQQAWELVGTASARAAHDRANADAEDAWSAAASVPTGTRPRARAFGEPGAWRRARFLAAAARLTDGDPYSPAFVRTAPWELRRLLADALAEEQTAALLAAMGMGFTVWHGVAASASADDATGILDHVVLSPSGLYAVSSEDFGGPVRFRQGELLGDGVGAVTPVRDLAARARAVARAARVRFGGGILILPDDDLVDPITALGRVRGLDVVVARRSALHPLLRQGVPGTRPIGGNELFDVRTRLAQTIRFRAAEED